MKFIVLALAITGAVASSYATPVVAGKTSAMPVPTCAPGTSTCGFGNW